MALVYNGMVLEVLSEALVYDEVLLEVLSVALVSDRVHESPCEVARLLIHVSALEHDSQR